MREDEIRPEDLRRQNSALRQADVAALIASRAQFVAAQCPACDGASGNPVFEKEGFSFLECDKCRTIFVSPRPTQEQLLEFYTSAKSVKHWKEVLFPASEEGRRSNLFAPRATRVAELCKKHGVRTRLLVDAGAGFGTFCEEIRNQRIFQRVLCVEASPDMAAACKTKGLEVMQSAAEDMHLQDVDVITSFEMIEHLFKPADFVRACARALCSGGLLILTTPNIKGFDLQVLGTLARNIGAPEHLNYFHAASLRLLLEHCGLDVLEHLTPGFLDAAIVRKEILAGAFDVSRQPFLRHVLIDEWEELGKPFQEFLAAHCLSSHLWVVARKK
jgi:2-polyprenyl-3-methyl-5-hydroxy-6-metoxy-1,4-benzoquinol methylase/Zn ribbon nucleic-acid-binding protein